MGHTIDGRITGRITLDGEPFHVIVEVDRRGITTKLVGGLIYEADIPWYEVLANSCVDIPEEETL